MDTKEKAKNIVFSTMLWSGIASVLNFLITMSVTPLVTNSLGTEAYGYITIVNNFISYATILTLALNSYATRYISVDYHKGDLNAANLYYNTVLKTNLISGMIILLIIFGITMNLDHIIVIPIALVRDVKILFVCMFLNFYFLLIGNTFLVSGYISNKLYIAGKNRVFGYLLELFLIIGCFKFFKPRVWYVGVGYFAYAVVIFITSYILVRKFTPALKMKKSFFSWLSVKKLVVAGVWNSINQLGNTLNSGLDLLISNIMLTPLIMGQLSIAKTIGGILCILYQLVSQAFQPMLLKEYASGKNDSLIEKFKIAMQISGLISGTVFVGFVILGKKFYALWIPNQDISYIYNLTVITLVSYVLEGIVGPLYYIYTLTIKNKIPCIITLIGGIVNVFSMYILLRFTNLEGYAVVGTTTAIMIFINLITNPVYMSYCLNVKWNTFYPIILRYLLFLFSGIIILSYFFIKKDILNWASLIFVAIIVCCACAILYFIIMLNYEQKKKIINIMMKKKG